MLTVARMEVHLRLLKYIWYSLVSQLWQESVSHQSGQCPWITLLVWVRSLSRNHSLGYPFVNILNCFFRSNSLEWVDFQTCVYQLLNCCVMLFPVLLSVWNRTSTISVILQYRRLISCAHLVEHDSKRPHVYLWPNLRVLLANLWCNVALSATACHHLTLAVQIRVTDVWQPKVTDLYSWQLPFGLFFSGRSVEEEILQLHVGVDDALGVDVL